MELRHLRYFLAVAEARTLSAAAEHLHIAQPALTQNIKSLEEELGACLFLRSKKGMELTDTGRMFMRHAQSILRQVSNAKHSVVEAETNPHGTVALAMPSSVSHVITAPLFTTLKEEAPNIKLLLSEGLTGDIQYRFRQGLADILLDFDVEESPEFEVETLVREWLYFIEQHPNKTPDPIRFSELVVYPLYLSRAMTDSLRQTLDRYASIENVQLEVLQGAPPMYAMLKLVESGMGYGILPWSAIYDLVGSRLSARKIVEPELMRNVCMVTDITRASSNATRKVMELIRRVVRQVHEEGLWHGELLLNEPSP